MTGLSVGSHTLEFRPRLRPSQFTDRRVRIAASSAAASTLLILQAVFPFLLFAGATGGEPLELELSGGTNVAWSLSFEYLDQVLLPTLQDRFGIRVERKLVARGWSLGPSTARGEVRLRIWPLRPGEALLGSGPMEEGQEEAAAPRRRREGYGTADFEVKNIDVSVLAPAHMHGDLQGALFRDLDSLFPGVEISVKVLEDSGLDSRIYVLLVARSETLRWGRDILTSAPKKAKAKGKGKESLSDYVSRKVCKDLYEELETSGVVDEFLQDQLIIFQALAEGETSFPRDNHGGGGNGLPQRSGSLVEGMEDLTFRERRKDKTHEPFGHGSTHATTARWVTAELLPKVGWYNKGTVCEGIGMRMEPPTQDEERK